MKLRSQRNKAARAAKEANAVKAQEIRQHERVEHLLLFSEAVSASAARLFTFSAGRMKHTLTFNRYLILLAVMLTASVGDTLLSHGMSQVGPVSIHHLGLLLIAMKNPWVIAGITLLIGFFCELSDCPELGRPHLRPSLHRLRLRRGRAARKVLAARKTSRFTAGSESC